MLLQKFPRVVIVQIGVGHQRVLVVAHHAGGGVKGKQKIHRSGNLERAFVAVALDAFQPLGVDGPRPHHARDLFAQRADARRTGHAEVTVVQGGIVAAQVLDRDRHAALKLVVVVRIQDVVLAVVLVVHDGVNATQALLKRIRRGLAMFILAIGKRACTQVRLGQVGPIGPVAAGDQLLQASTVAAGARAKHAPGGLTLCFLLGHAFGLGLRRFALHTGTNRVDVIRLIFLRDGRHCTHGRIKQVDQVGESIAKEAGHAQCHVNPRTAFDAHGHDFNIHHPGAACCPLGPHT